jgi:alpha-beta hydrolase superfamily lysophospholipase
MLGQSHGALLLIHAVLGGLTDLRGLILTSPYLRAAFPIPAWKLAVGRLADRCLPWLPIPSEIRPEMLCRDSQGLEFNRNDSLRLQIATPRWFFTARQAQVQAVARAAEVRLPVLVIQGEQDPVADPAAAREFFERAGSTDKSYRSFPGLRHETHREQERAVVREVILEWLRDRTPS